MEMNVFQLALRLCNKADMSSEASKVSPPPPPLPLPLPLPSFPRPSPPSPLLPPLTNQSISLLCHLFFVVVSFL